MPSLFRVRVTFSPETWQDYLEKDTLGEVKEEIHPFLHCLLSSHFLC